MGKSRIKELWEQLSETERRLIISEVVKKGNVDPSTVYKWMRGERKPLPLYQQLITKIISKYTGGRLMYNVFEK